MAKRSPRSERSPALRARAKLWLESDEEYALGLGIAEILAAVERTGSIKAASAEVGKSYRHVWARIKAVEATLGVSLVETRVGGADRQRSSLRPEAGRLVAEFLALRERVFALVDEEYATRLQPALAALLDSES